MKIVTKKINSEPNHSILKKDVKAIIQVIPDDWKNSLKARMIEFLRKQSKTLDIG